MILYTKIIDPREINPKYSKRQEISQKIFVSKIVFSVLKKVGLTKFFEK